MSALEQVRPLVEEKCRNLGYELFEARLFRAGSRSILRICIDSPAGVTIADCERASNEISVLLDVENFLGGRSYVLEVSSPGIDRPLKTERDFRRILGKEVTVHLKEPVNGKSHCRGVVISCENNALDLDCDGAAVTLSLDQVLSGKEEISFKRSGKEQQ